MSRHVDVLHPSPDLTLRLHAACDQVFDGNQLQTKLVRDASQVRKPRHGAILIHDLNQDTCRAKAGKPRKVDSGFRMTRSPEHTLPFCLQWKYVAGLSKLIRSCLRISQGFDSSET